MAEHDSPKFPASSSEIAELFGFNKKPEAPHGHDSHPEEPASEASAKAPAPANLPSAAAEPADHGAVHVGPGHEPAAAEHDDIIAHDVQAAQSGTGRAGRILKTVMPYLLVFGVGLTLYFFFFQTFDFGKIFRSAPSVSSPKETALEAAAKDNTEAYERWIAGYYYDVSDRSVLEPGKDNSGNGLTNFQKFLLNLNPKSYDTLGLGMADSEAIAQGVNPLTGRGLTEQQKQIVEKYFDMEIVMNRLTVAHLQQNGRVAGTVTTVEPALEGVRSDIGNLRVSPVNGSTGSGTLPNPFINSSNSGNTFPQSGSGSSTNGSGSGSGQVNLNSYSPTGASSGIVLDGMSLEINTDIPGRLEVPSLGINVPVIFSKDPKDFDRDLQIGVVHYPGTALPGQIGTAYISGHSSNYAWARGDYNKVFAKIDKLADYTSFKVTVVQKNGKDAVLHYVVRRRQEYKPTDQAQFANTGVSTVALSTCWPINTTQKRLVVFGELTQVVK